MRPLKKRLYTSFFAYFRIDDVTVDVSLLITLKFTVSISTFEMLSYHILDDVTVEVSLITLKS